MSIIDPPSLTKFQANALFPRIPYKTVATRILTGRVAQTVTNSSTTTYQITTALSQQFEAVRIIFANSYNQASFNINVCGASVIAGTSDLNNSSGTWNTIPGFALNMAPMNSDISCGYTFSPWISIQSIPRTDGGTLPLLVLRAVIRATSTAVPSYGDGIDDFTNWATKPDGHIWASRSQVGDFATTPSGFTSTTNLSSGPIIGVQYAALGKVVTVMSVGDSITEGRGTYKGEGFNLPACQALTNPNDFAIEYANCGWSGQTPLEYVIRGRYLIDTELSPDVLIMPLGSPNVAVPLPEPLLLLMAEQEGSLLQVF